jgi:flagellin
MRITHNSIVSQLFVPYEKNIRTLSATARRLATGEKIPTAADGAGELSLAERWEQRIRGNSQLIGGMVNTTGYTRTQDEALGAVNEIIQRMSELASTALDTTKSNDDRNSLDAEFQALIGELGELRSRQYNGINLFSNTLTVRINIDPDTLTISALSMQKQVYSHLTGLDITTSATAEGALSDLTSVLMNLAGLRSRAGSSTNELERLIDFTRTEISEMRVAMDSVRNIDLAVETGKFTQQQVMLSASQSAIAQSNNIVQTALQFLT